MATIVAFHAHPDDEALATGGTLARLAAEGHRAALAAHRSFIQSKGRSAGLARTMLALPVPVFGLLFGREWFVEPGAEKTAVSGDILGRPERADLV